MEEAGDGRLRFVHDKIREVAYERLAGVQRPALHRAAAEAMETVLVTSAGASWRAGQALGGGRAEQGGECYLPAARAAVARYAQR
jgi:hypothetical protein